MLPIKANKKIVLIVVVNIIIVVGLFIMTNILVGEFLLEAAFRVTPHTWERVPCLGCGENPSIYTYLLYWFFLIAIIFIYTLIITKLIKVVSKKNFWRVFVYSAFIIAIIYIIQAII